MEEVGEDPKLSPGARLGQYEVVRLIGEGGMGSVYEGVHTGLKKRVAIKTLHKSVAAISEARARFLREGEAASRIHHPNVVSVFDLGTHEGMPYLVMEFLEGEDLSGLLERRGALTIAETVDVMLPVCAAVAAAHTGGVVHRDLKPQNVFLARDGAGKTKPTVLDFGVSKLVEPGSMRVTNTTALLGTPLYMAPEQAEGAGRADARADQFSLGVMLYECVTGRTPYDAESFGMLIHLIISGKYQSPRAHRPDLSPEFEAVILRAMALDMTARYASVRELGAALLPFGGDMAKIQWGDAFGPAPVTTLPPNVTAPMRVAAAVAPTSPGDLPALSTAVRTQRTSARWPALVGAGVLTCVTIAAALAMRPSDSQTASAPGRVPAAALPASLGPGGATGTPSVPGAALRVHVAAQPASAMIEIDGTEAGTGSVDREVPRDGAEHSLTVRAPGYLTRTVHFRDAPPPESLELSPDPAYVAHQGAGTESGDDEAGEAHRRPGAHGARRNPSAGGVHHGGPVRRGANGALILR